MIFVTFTAFSQQKGSVKGFVKTLEGQPATGVAAALKGTSKGLATDIEGAFEIQNINPGMDRYKDQF